VRSEGLLKKELDVAIESEETTTSFVVVDAQRPGLPRYPEISVNVWSVRVPAAQVEDELARQNSEEERLLRDGYSIEPYSRANLGFLIEFLADLERPRNPRNFNPLTNEILNNLRLPIYRSPVQLIQASSTLLSTGVITAAHTVVRHEGTILLAVGATIIRLLVHRGPIGEVNAQLATEIYEPQVRRLLGPLLRSSHHLAEQQQRSIVASPAPISIDSVDTSHVDRVEIAYQRLSAEDQVAFRSRLDASEASSHTNTI